MAPQQQELVRLDKVSRASASARLHRQCQAMPTPSTKGGARTRMSGPQVNRGMSYRESSDINETMAVIFESEAADLIVVAGRAAVLCTMMTLTTS